VAASQFDLALTLKHCNEIRLARLNEQQRLQRISMLDPTKDDARVALVPIDSRKVALNTGLFWMEIVVLI